MCTQYADTLYGTDFDPKEVEKDTDLEGEIASEVKRLKRGTEQRFQVVNSGVKNVIFIECRNPVDPCKLVHAILSDAQKSGVCRARCVSVCCGTVLVIALTIKDDKTEIA